MPVLARPEEREKRVPWLPLTAARGIPVVLTPLLLLAAWYDLYVPVGGLGSPPPGPVG